MNTGSLPCDIYAAAGTPCAAAHSMTRALFSSYSGPLYQVQRASDNTTLDVGLLAKGDYANIAPQDDFCVNTSCVVTRIYDQTANHNDLAIEGPGGNGGADHGAPADALPVRAGGHQVYGLLISAQMGYRNNSTKGIARNGDPEGMYMVTSGTHVNNACCFDYGNAEISGDDTGNGHMDAINFSTECWFAPCSGQGPWVQADLENGLFQSNAGYSLNSGNTGMALPFVTAMLKNDGQSRFVLRDGNAQSGIVTSEYLGGEPSSPGYSPMHQEGAIVLGTGGDNSNGSIGSFFEGVMTAGFPTDATDAAVQANIVGVGYDTATSVYGTLAAGSEISIQLTSPGYTGYYLRHQAAAGTQEVVASQLGSSSPASDLADATWVVRRGFANPKCFSFEARNRPGEFIRHYNYKLYSQPYDGSATNAADATFCAVAGNGGSGYSLQSQNYSTKYIRSYQLVAYIADGGGSNAWDASAGWAQDTTFQVVSPLQP